MNACGGMLIIAFSTLLKKRVKMDKNDIESEFDKIPDEIMHPIGEPFLITVCSLWKKLFLKEK